MEKDFDVKSLKDELVTLHRQVGGYKSQLLQLQERCNDMKDKVKKMEKNLYAAHGVVVDLEYKLTQAKRDLNEKNMECDRLKNDILMIKSLPWYRKIFLR